MNILTNVGERQGGKPGRDTMAKSCLFETLNSEFHFPLVGRCTVHSASVAAVAVLSAAWLSMDLAVIVKSAADSESDLFSFLTNDVWLFGLVIRILMVVRYIVVAHASKQPQSETRCRECFDVDTALAISWIVLGSAQVGIFFTFFTLIGIDETILTHYAVDNHVKISTIIIWNSIRHSMPIMCHSTITAVISPWLVTHTRARHDQNKQVGPTLGVVLWTVASAPLYGLIYFMAFHPSRTYQYSDNYTGIVCANVFAATCIAASLLLVFSLPFPYSCEPVQDANKQPYHYAKIGASLEG